MTRTRMAGRFGDRTSPAVAALTPMIIVIAIVAVGCADGRQSTASPSTAPPSSASASPDGSAGTGPRPTAWPGSTVFGIEALGAADGQILAAINDFNRGIATEDLVMMRRAADGLAGLDVLLPNLDKINGFEPMRPFAEQYGTAIRGIVASAIAVRSAIDARDPSAITSSSQALIESLRAYTGVQAELASWVEQSIAQRRLLLR